MSKQTWSEYFWGTEDSSLPTEPAPPPAEIENALPDYKTLNDLPPQFQLTPEHDPNYIFPAEIDLIREVRSQVPQAENYPERFILIFLFSRRHSVPHSVKLLAKHLDMLKSMGFPEVTEDSPYPFTADMLTDTEKHWAINVGPTLYKHILVDKQGRLLQYIRPRNWVQGRIKMQRYISTIIWWYYYTFQHVPLSVHRNGMSVVVDMKDMGWSNLDFSSDVQHFISSALSCFPGRMRHSWIVNANWIFSTAWALAKLVLSTKVISRMHQVDLGGLEEVIEKDLIPKDLGGDWEPDVEREWYDRVLELDRVAKEAKGEILDLNKVD